MLIYFLPVGAAFGKTEYSIFQITVKYKAVGMHGIPVLEKYQYLFKTVRYHNFAQFDISYAAVPVFSYVLYNATLIQW